MSMTAMNTRATVIPCLRYRDVCRCAATASRRREHRNSPDSLGRFGVGLGGRNAAARSSIRIGQRCAAAGRARDVVRRAP
jgi:hypothetical protein